jgi:hypothetical protein
VILNDDDDENVTRYRRQLDEAFNASLCPGKTWTVYWNSQEFSQKSLIKQAVQKTLPF